ncbi:MAG TPA: hypothetical protein PKC97_07960 [Burkholderiaceae bacterium]|nr:hypothetical protein [Burkholderiaceae bacterium]
MTEDERIDVAKQTLALKQDSFAQQFLRPREPAGTALQLRARSSLEKSKTAPLSESDWLYRAVD